MWCKGQDNVKAALSCSVTSVRRQNLIVICTHAEHWPIWPIYEVIP